MQDLGGRQDDHAENDLEESQGGSGHGAPAWNSALDWSTNSISQLPKSSVRYQATDGIRQYSRTPHPHRAVLYYRPVTDPAMRHPCRLIGQDIEGLAGVLAQCPALAHLSLSGQCDWS